MLSPFMLEANKNPTIRCSEWGPIFFRKSNQARHSVLGGPAYGRDQPGLSKIAGAFSGWWFHA